MNMNIRTISLSISVVLLAVAGPALADEHEGDLVVGRTGANQLRVEFDFVPPIALPPVNGLLKGWALDDPGFDHLESDEPNENFFVLGDGAQVRFDVVSFAPAFKAWTPGFGAVLHNPGDAYVFPDGHLLHGHLDWHIDSQDPLFDPAVGPWMASFRLVDVGTTGYSPSDVYTFTFTPEPSSLALLMLGGLTALRRRVG
jgi:hypothetical protein